jgi:antimicrobial peptide system SdpA family protein
MALLAVAPEGWAFFTRNPREPRIEAFAINAAGDWQPVNWQNAALDLGFSRRGRVLHLALSWAVTQVPIASWHPCQEHPVRCGSRIERTRVPLDLSTPATRYLPRGRDLILYVAPPVPWAWSRSKEAVTMPGRVVRVLFADAAGDRQ